jgi:histidyl-tRNA synthetase
VQGVRGMQDIFGESLKKFNFVVQKASEVARRGAFFSLNLPILEFASVFERNLGNDTDILQKEIYKFEDRGGDVLALRPEFTASVVRSFVQHNFKLPVRIFSYGPLFRYDRPQKGRFRQFNQVNFESIGEDNAFEDANIITLAYNFLSELNIDGGFELEINYLGSKETLNNYKQILIDYFNQNINSLSAISKVRLKNNPIRILDSKEPEDIEICKNAPKISSIFLPEERKRFEEILNLLKSCNVQFKINEFIVRGLDYYTGVVFEFTTKMLGSQSTILAGGRYNNLIEQMGGKSVPAIGFAGGVERLSLLVKNDFELEKCLFIIPINQDYLQFSFKMLTKLQNFGIVAQILHTGNVGKRIEKASKSNFKSFVVVIGEDEKKDENLKIKNLETGFQQEGNFDFIISCLK